MTLTTSDIIQLSPLPSYNIILKIIKEVSVAITSKDIFLIKICMLLSVTNKTREPLILLLAKKE